jgi:hypothetical protein
MPKQARQSKNGTSSSGKSCPQCQEGPEYYRMIYNRYKFDVDLARKLTSDGRESYLLEKDDVEHAVAWAHIHEPHLDHVDLQYPGIVAHYWFVTKDDELLHGTVLIDGHHRAARALREGVPFYVRVMSEQESKQVTMREPEAVTARLK